MTNSSSSLSKVHEHWKGKPHKPREVMTTKLPSGRSRGVCAYYCKQDENGRMVPDEIHDHRK